MQNSIKEVVVVEGRDDTAAVLRALPCETIETHGFGIKKETWDLLKKAYDTKGLIIFTDPDHSGVEIRKKLSEKFPNAKQAYLIQEDAYKDGDIGIENAKPESILKALESAKCTLAALRNEFSMKDIFDAGLSGRDDAAKRRNELGKILGIGYSNANSFLKKLNSYDITREEFEKALKEIDK